MGRGFQAVQRCVAPGSERRMASLATERLDVLGLSMLAIADKRVNGSISDAEVSALLVRTSEAGSGYTLRCSPTAFHLAPGAHRCRSWFHAWRGEATDRAITWGAGLEQTVDQSTSPACLCMGKLKIRPRKAPKQR